MSDDWNPGEARMWARRLRKVGFGPVTLHFDTDGSADDPTIHEPGRWYLRCIWPYDVADLPPDLHIYFTHQNADDYDGTYAYLSAVRLVWDRDSAQGLLNRFREVRLGMGSRPLPIVARDPCEPTCVPLGRFRWDSDDWRRETQRHPDYQPDMTMDPNNPKS